MNPSAPALDRERIEELLGTVNYPGLNRDLVSFGMVEQVSVCDGRVKVRLALVSQDPSIPARLKEAISAALTPHGAVAVEVEIVTPSAAAARAPGGSRDPWRDQAALSRVGQVIAVGAGKGGVGKSTVAANLALALAREGVSTGLLDADIHGPSLPILLGIEDGAERVRMDADKTIIPLNAHGIPLISFGFFIGAGSPAIWRGPMVSKAVKQFSRGVAWPRLDVLIVDLPPGTGDIPLSLAQSVVLSGAIVVTQPARLALNEAAKAVEMFHSLEVPVLGVVENMTGAFGQSDAASYTEKLGCPLLGSIPFDAAMVAEGDTGSPTVVARPDSEVALAFRTLADAVASRLGWQRSGAAEVA